MSDKDSKKRGINTRLILIILAFMVLGVAGFMISIGPNRLFTSLFMPSDEIQKCEKIRDILLTYLEGENIQTVMTRVCEIVPPDRLVLLSLSVPQEKGSYLGVLRLDREKAKSGTLKGVNRWDGYTKVGYMTVDSETVEIRNPDGTKTKKRQGYFALPYYPLTQEDADAIAQGPLAPISQGVKSEKKGAADVVMRPKVPGIRRGTGKGHAQITLKPIPFGSRVLTYRWLKPDVGWVRIYLLAEE